MAGNRGGELQLGFIGIGHNSSLGRAPHPFFSVKLEHLGHIGKVFSELIGGSMTWEELGSLTIKWGENETIKYSELKPGWDYRWEIGTWDFIVTDDLGNKTTEKINNFSGLGISWDILESPQFSIHFSAKFENAAFLPAWKYKKGVKPPPDEPDPDIPVEDPLPELVGEIQLPLWGEFEKYLKKHDHSKLKYLINKDSSKLNGEVIENITVELSKYQKSILLAKSIKLNSTGNFPINMVDGNKIRIGKKEYREILAETYVIGNFLMIAVFASIHDMSKPVFEPWMLWHMWQWFGHSGVTIRRDRVFDLSPCWG